MNEVEKRAVKILGKEEREKIVGDTAENDELTNEQCENLRNAIRKLSKEQQMQIAGGKKSVNKKIEFCYGMPIWQKSTEIPLVSYGGIPGVSNENLYNVLNTDNIPNTTQQ